MGTPFFVFDRATGEVIRSGHCPERDVNNQIDNRREAVKRDADDRSQRKQPSDILPDLPAALREAHVDDALPERPPQAQPPPGVEPPPPRAPRTRPV